MNQTFVSRIIALVCLLVGTLLIWQPTSLWSQQLAGLVSFNNEDGLLTVAFLDVGQGDAIYIETTDGVQLLIDGGPDSAVLRELPRVMPWWDRSLDMILATHADKDHIGGLVDVLTRYDVSTILRTENESDTAVSSAFVLMSAEENATIHIARAGEVVNLGASTTLTIFSPASDTSEWESNSSSIVAKLSYGEIDFMFTGDAGTGIEEYLVSEYGTLLDSEVLKLGHHGSKTSTAAEFLAVVSPEYAVVSAGKDNRYGHPHEEVIKRVEEFGSEIVNTAQVGTVVFKSDGKRVWLK